MIEGSSKSRVHPTWLAVSAVLLLAVNLRMAVSSVGAVLPDVRDGSGLGGFATGLLTALPPFCFGIAGLTGPAIARRIGLHRTALLTLGLITVGQIVRAAVPGAFWLFVGSVVALGAIALANVILPSIVREMFPRQIAGMTAAYTVVMSLAQAMVAFSTIPLMHAFGGDWRVGIGMWAAVAVLAILPWLPLARHEAPPVRSSAHRIPLRTIARVPRAWILALFFGSQSMQAYIAFGWYPTLLRDEGLARQSAAAQVGIVSVAATIATIFAPTLLTRLRRPAIVTWVLFAGYVLGYLGLLAWPLQLATLWSLLIGIGQTYFPIALYVVNLRARTPTGVLSLSGFMQSVGYIWAGTGLLLLGTIHGGSTDWNGVLVVMIGLVCLLQILALISVSRWSIEDELRARRLQPAADEHECRDDALAGQRLDGEADDRDRQQDAEHDQQ